MATIIRESVIDVAPADAWAALRDFGGVDRRLAVGFVTDCTLDAPDVRTIRFFDGAVAKERLVGVDEATRRLAYSVIESRLELSHHNGAAQIIEHGDGIRFVWIADVLPDELAPAIAGRMNAGIAAIKSTLERRDFGSTRGTPEDTSVSSIQQSV
jgi:hypothetical protein